MISYSRSVGINAKMHPGRNRYRKKRDCCSWLEAQRGSGYAYASLVNVPLGAKVGNFSGPHPVPILPVLPPSSDRERILANSSFAAEFAALRFGGYFTVGGDSLGTWVIIKT